MVTIPLHTLQSKSLHHDDFEIVPLDGSENYDIDVPHRHNFFELMIFKTGGGKHEIDFKEYPIQAQSIHLISPTQVHKLYSQTAKGIVICFKEEFIAPFARHSFIETFRYYDFTRFSPVLAMDTDFFSELCKLSENLENNYERHSAIKRDILGSYLYLLLLCVKDFFIEKGFSERNSIGSANPKILEFKKLIGAHYLEHLNITDYASTLNISSNYLNSLCKKETSQTAIGLIQERILLEAKRLLYSTNLSIKEISHLLNFETDAYFVRFFKKKVGVTPLEYRTK